MITVKEKIEFFEKLAARHQNVVIDSKDMIKLMRAMRVFVRLNNHKCSRCGCPDHVCRVHPDNEPLLREAQEAINDLENRP